MSQVWQEPFVNFFKYYGVGEWKKCMMEGDVTKVMDRAVKGSVYRICGSLPSRNFINFPKSFSSSLGLHGRFLYILFKPVVGKFFSIHFDVQASDGTTVRISLSNIFNTFKVTSSWIQFPVVFNPLKGSIDEVTYMLLDEKEKCVTVPKSAYWTLLVFDMHFALATYINKCFSHLKCLRLCSSMFVKNVFTSSNDYQPGLNITFARKTGMLASGVIPLPIEMSFPLEKDNDWHNKYIYLKLPDSSHIVLERNHKSNLISSQAKSYNKKTNITSELSSMEKSYIDQPKEEAKKVTRLSEPQMNEAFSTLPKAHAFGDAGIEIYTSSQRRGRQKTSNDQSLNCDQVEDRIKSQNQDLPLLQLNKVIGFGGGTYKNVFWTDAGHDVIYPCHSIVVIHNILSGKQSFLLGHINNISALTISSESKFLASAETGCNSSIRIWKIKTKQCVALFQTSIKDVSILSFSLSSEIIASVGMDTHSKQIICIWNVSSKGKIQLMTKAYTDFSENGINKFMFTSFDEHKLISCGLNNIRVWKLKPNSLRSIPIELGKFCAVHFTDFVFQQHEATSKLSLFLTSTSGTVYEVDFGTLKLLKIHTLFGLNDEIVSLNTISFMKNFFAIGSSDSHLRLWSTDFQTVLMDATHDNPLTAISISKDGNQILAGTDSGTLGILHIASLTYTTLTRSHTSDVISFSFDQVGNHIVSITYDNYIKLWDSKTYSLIYEFNEKNESPLSVCCHPFKSEFVCGFQSGAIRVFSLATTSLLFEIYEHNAEVSHVLFSQSGEFLYTCCAKGNLVLHSTCNQEYSCVRSLSAVVRKKRNREREKEIKSDTFFSIDEQGDKLAVIGPTTLSITIFVARTLDEILQIDLPLADNKSRKYAVEAEIVQFSPSTLAHLLVVTSMPCLLLVDVSTGQLLKEVFNIHPSPLTSLSCSLNGKYIATAALGVIKIWDYSMKNPQAFVGHSKAITKMKFSEDNQVLITAGETLFIWKVMAISKDNSPNENRFSLDTKYIAKDCNYDTSFHQIVKKSSFDSKNKQLEGIFQKIGDEESADNMRLKTIDIDYNTDVDFEISRNYELNQEIDKTHQSLYPRTPLSCTSHRLQIYHAVPQVLTHFKARKSMSTFATRHYAAPANKAGIKLISSIGFNRVARKNICWHPPAGLFAYTMGSLLAIDDLNSCNQHILLNHLEEISTIAVKHDGKQIATAACYSHDIKFARICLWKINTEECFKVLDIHKSNIVAMEFSRDDQYLLTVGDYTECLVIVWNANTFICLESFKTLYAIHAVMWHPYVADQFVSVGQKKTVTFWEIKDEMVKLNLKCVQGLVPKSVFLSDVQNDDMTAVCYADRNWLFTATVDGVVCLWNILTKTCTSFWKADSLEIITLAAGCGKLVTGGASKILRQWSVDLKKENYVSNGIVLEKEIDLESLIISSIFDEHLETGVVATDDGTIWCVDWNDVKNVPIVSSHKDMITDFTVCRGEEKFMASTSIDGGLRLWNLETREKVAQFLISGQEAICVDFVPHVFSSYESKNLSKNKHQNSRDLPSQCVAGYSDGVVRKFDFGQLKMTLKIKLFKNSVTQVLCSTDGAYVTSGSSDGLLTISNLGNGVPLRVITEHRGAQVCNLRKQYTNSSSYLWLISSIDCRISVWRSDWAMDLCELNDWITFPTNQNQTNAKIRYPCLAEFTHHNNDIIIYTGFSVCIEICLYCLSEKQTLKTIPLNDWSISISISYDGNFLAAGFSNRIVKLIDTEEGTFQDFVGHSDAVTNVKFAYNTLLTNAHTELFIWKLLI